jgi:hypothetical protein
VNVADIAEADLATLKAEGYTEEDLSHLADTEVQSLLPQKDADDEGATGKDDKTAAEGQTEGAANSEANTEGATEEEGEVEANNTFVPQYSADVPADADAQIKALRLEERAAFKQLMDGEIDADEYQAIRDRTESEADELKTKALTASIFEQANAQAAEQAARNEWMRAEKAAFESFKADGLDYKSKPALLAAYNTNLKALGADPKNENRDAAWFLSEAHKLTRADLGFTTASKVPNTPGKIPKRVDAPEIPPTLRGTPASATGAVNSDEFSHLRTLMDSDPIGFERAVAKLTPEQRDRWMAE